MVLSALTSPGMVAASATLLRRGGRFVEIGKRDIWSHAALAACRPDVAYHVLAMDFLPEDVLQKSLQRLTAELATGGLRPLQAVSHGVNATAAGLRQLSQVRHPRGFFLNMKPRKPCHFLPVHSDENHELEEHRVPFTAALAFMLESAEP